MIFLDFVFLETTLTHLDTAQLMTLKFSSFSPDAHIASTSTVLLLLFLFDEGESSTPTAHVWVVHPILE
jgi:hypothetical protein